MKSFPAALIAALLLFACQGDKVAGGTDEVENPALTAVLADGHGGAASGSVQVFARFQNPVKDAAPILSLAADGKAIITDSMLLLAMDSARIRGIPWKNRDTVAFNLMGTNAALEAFRGSYLLVRPAGGAYRFRRVHPGEEAYPDGKGSLSTALTMLPPVLACRGRVGPRGLELGLKSVFIPGSSYAAQVEADGSFAFSRLAQGRYEVKAMDKDAKVYSSFDSLNTATEFVPSDWTEADIIWLGD